MELTHVTEDDIALPFSHGHAKVAGGDGRTDVESRELPGMGISEKMEGVKDLVEGSINRGFEYINNDPVPSDGKLNPNGR